MVGLPHGVMTDTSLVAGEAGASKRLLGDMDRAFTMIDGKETKRTAETVFSRIEAHQVQVVANLRRFRDILIEQEHPQTVEAVCSAIRAAEHLCAEIKRARRKAGHMNGVTW